MAPVHFLVIIVLVVAAVTDSVMLKAVDRVDDPEQQNVYLKHQFENKEQTDLFNRAVHEESRANSVTHKVHNGTHTTAHHGHNGTQTTAHHGNNGTHTAGHTTAQHETSAVYRPPAVGFNAILTPDFLTISHKETIVFDHLLVNIGNAYNIRQGHFTAPVSGLYSFTANIKFRSSNTAELNASIVKNGDNIGLLYLYGADTTTRTTVVMLDVGDIVWLKNNVNNSPRIYGGGLSTFSGFLITPAD
ncbi:complement C1q tumor necrosis factor-related protein 3-like [Pecten maximus]|uniref:complement C1q tumor necrosis factor-related protein 3-like n=1 Tax=Pecten maximus TaxID=6579 RepID=UPI001458D649|nr:complement C1q tumor necrosis factor-related protein 3-like [Pecten maximus]